MTKIDAKNYKDKFCPRFKKKNKCKYKEFCFYAHVIKSLTKNNFLKDKKELGQKILKKRNCKKFFFKGFCKYGKNCYYDHDLRTIDEINFNCFYQKTNYLSI